MNEGDSMAKRNPHYLLPRTPFPSYQKYLKALGSFPRRRLEPKFSEKNIEEIEQSGLRGRGGAGFPTGRKWRTLFSHPCSTRYVVCNAAEGEPGTFKDRYLIRQNPYAVLEGLVTAFFAIKAKAIYLAVKKSFNKEITRLQQAVLEMKEQGILSGIPLEWVDGPEEYLFGEEKALLNVIENEGPFPRPADQPPYERGLFATPGSANPALVNNVQTLAHISTILRHGANSFRKVGCAGTPGTILVTLSGAIRNQGIFEVEAGTSLRRILKNFGGGPKAGRRLKGVLPGVSTGIISAKEFEVPVDFDAPKKIGSGLASAGFVVLDDKTSMARVLQGVARFLYVESCTQCFACKEGLRRASEGIDQWLSSKAANEGVVREILKGARSAPQGNRCYLPVQGSELISSLFKKFSTEILMALKRPEKFRKEWILPKMTDFDAGKRKFVYDKRQALKEPDWTYRPVPVDKKSLA